MNLFGLGDGFAILRQTNVSKLLVCMRFVLVILLTKRGREMLIFVAFEIIPDSLPMVSGVVFERHYHEIDVFAKYKVYKENQSHC